MNIFLLPGALFYKKTRESVVENAPHTVFPVLACGMMHNLD